MEKSPVGETDRPDAVSPSDQAGEEQSTETAKAKFSDAASSDRQKTALVEQGEPSDVEPSSAPDEKETPTSVVPGEARSAELKASGELPVRAAETGEQTPAEQTRRWRTVADEVGEIHSYPSAETARKDLGVRPGKELHHIVEQGQASPERSGFSVLRINRTDNLVYLPADVHTEVSRHYSSQVPGAGMTVRDGLNGTPWEQQHDYGREAIDDAWEQVELHRDPEDLSSEPSWRTVADELGEVRSYPSFDAAGKDLGVRPGKELHHIVEQSQSSPERSGFSAIRINRTDNLVYLPADVHTEVSRHYSTQVPGAGMTIRDGLNGTPWDHQHDYGREAINDAWRRVRGDGED